MVSTRTLLLTALAATSSLAQTTSQLTTTASVTATVPTSTTRVVVTLSVPSPTTISYTPTGTFTAGSGPCDYVYNACIYPSASASASTSPVPNFAACSAIKAACEGTTSTGSIGLIHATGAAPTASGAGAAFTGAAAPVVRLGGMQIGAMVAAVGVLVV